jgi:hypothetical protein
VRLQHQELFVERLCLEELAHLPSEVVPPPFFIYRTQVFPHPA